MKYWQKAITITTGCTKVSPACLHCWAETNHNRFMRNANKKYDHDFSEVRVHPENIDIINKTRKSTTFAVWNDLFHSAVSDSIIHDILNHMRYVSHHKFLILTKRPERMAQIIEYQKNTINVPSNIYLGTTVENQEMADKRIPELLKCKPFRLFLSIEPMLEAIIIDEILYSYDATDNIKVIAGCESGHHARPTDKDWILDLRQQCIRSNVPLWIKQLKINGKMVYDHPLSTIKRKDLWKQKV